MSPEFAPDDAASRALVLLAPDQLAEWRAGLDAPARRWIEETGFEAAPGDVRLIPGSDGAVQSAVAGLGSAQARARGRFFVAKVMAGLPAGAWHLQDTLSPHDQSEAALAALLGQYRFDRYRPGSKARAPALLKAPTAVDAQRLLAMASGEFLTRDLINTPAEDMGPA